MANSHGSCAAWRSFYVDSLVFGMIFVANRSNVRICIDHPILSSLPSGESLQLSWKMNVLRHRCQYRGSSHWKHRGSIFLKRIFKLLEFSTKFWRVGYDPRTPKSRKERPDHCIMPVAHNYDKIHQTSSWSTRRVSDSMKEWFTATNSDGNSPLCAVAGSQVGNRIVFKCNNQTQHVLSIISKTLPFWLVKPHQWLHTNHRSYFCTHPSPSLLGRVPW